MNMNFREWNTFYDASWYAYGAFIGEAVTRDTRSDKTNVLRIAMSVWILFCMIMAFSYSGTLRSFLITPIKNAPMSTLDQVSKATYH